MGISLRHLATGGIARFNYVLVMNLNPVTTCESDGRVIPYPNMVACLKTLSLANSKWDYSPRLNCSHPSFLLHGLSNTKTTAAYCVENKILRSNAHFFFVNSPDTKISPFLHFQTSTMSPLRSPVRLTPRQTHPPSPVSNQQSRWRPTLPLLTILTHHSMRCRIPFCLSHTLISKLRCLTLLLTLTLLQLRLPRRAPSPLQPTFHARQWP